MPLDGCAADALLEDERIALAYPMEASMKKPVTFDASLLSTVAAIQVRFMVCVLFWRGKAGGGGWVVWVDA